MVFQCTGKPQNGAETARVVETQQGAVGKFKIGVVVFLRRRMLAGLVNTQAAGHAQMDNQITGAGVNQQILGTPTHRRHGLAA